MTENGATGSGTGVILNPVPKRISPSKNWCFTLNNYTEEHIKLITSHIGSNDLYIFGKEIAPTTNTRHLQGFISFEKKTRPLEKIPIKNIHWEKCKGSKDDNIKYCMKDGDYITNIPNGEIRKLQPLKLISNLRPFQKQIVEMIEKEPDDRTIVWIYESKGNVGKTQLCKYLSNKYNAIPLEGKKNDILFCAAQYPSEVYIYDLERSMEDYVSYASIEKIKNGYFMCSKYESKPIIRNSPHVIIMSNFLPDTSQLSLDRWRIYTIDDAHNLILYEEKKISQKRIIESKKTNNNFLDKLIS